MRTKKSHALTLVQGGAGVGASGCASTTCGCESHAGITSLSINKEAQLSELLNDLERKVETLESKYLEVCDMWITASEHLVKLLPTIKEMDTTD